MIHPRVLCCLAGMAMAGAATYDDGLRLKAQGKLPEAEAAFRDAVAAKPADPDATAQLATVVGWLGRHGESEHLWEKALALRPADADLAIGLARVRYWQGEHDPAKHDQAAADLDAVLLRVPDYPDALLLAGDVALARHRPEQARGYWQRVLVRQPGDPDASARLARLGGPGTWRPRIRLDVSAGIDHFSGDRGRERFHSLAIGVTLWRELTVLAGYDSLYTFGQREERYRIGAASAPIDGLEIEAGAAWTPENEVLADRELTAGASYRLLSWLTPFVSWRHLDYSGAGDRIDLFQIGERVHPVEWVWAEGKYQFAEARNSHTTEGGGIRIGASWQGIEPQLGWFRAEEAAPPLQPAMVTSWTAGIAFIHDNGGLRIDGSVEERGGHWYRSGIAVGVFARY